jgi:hypothetical protein
VRTLTPATTFTDPTTGTKATLQQFLSPSQPGAADGRAPRGVQFQVHPQDMRTVSCNPDRAQLDQLEELRPRAVSALIALVTANEFCFHAAHRHAEVGRFHHHRHRRRDLVADDVGNLIREPLLHLQAARELDEPGILLRPITLLVGM